MRSRAGRVGRGAAALALAAVLAVPAAAAAATFPQQRVARLRAAVGEALELRQARFGRAERSVSGAVGRLRGLCAGVRGAGGDVTQVLNLLDLAEEALAEAASTEEDAAAAFATVPDAPDRRAAFSAARETARRAVEELRRARQLTLRAADELRRVSEGLRAEGEL